MRLRIRHQPTGVIDGVSLQHFRRGLVYEVGTQLASVLLAEGWAEPVDDAEATSERHSFDGISTAAVGRPHTPRKN